MDESHTRMERISSRKNIRIVTRFSWVFFQRSLNALLTESMAYVDNMRFLLFHFLMKLHIVL